VSDREEEGSASATTGEAKSAGARIAGAATILLAGFALSRVIGLGREIVLSAQFGTGEEYDLFVAAFRIPDVVFTLVAGGALGSTLVPVFAERDASGNPGAAARLASTVFNLIALAAGAVALIGIALAPWLAPLLGPGFSPEQQIRLALLIRILLVQPVLLGISEVFGRYLNVRGHFLAPAFAPALYNVPIILAALAAGPALGAVGLAIGVVAGALLYFLVQVPAALSWGLRFTPRLDLRDPALRQIVRLMVPRMIGQGAVQLSFIATTRLASQQGEGAIAALNYAWILTMLPLGPLGMAIGNAALPTMSAQAARGELDALGDTARRTLTSILFMIVPAALLLATVGLPIVQAIYERRAFTVESSTLTATVLAFYASGLPAHGAIEILTRTFYALQDTRTPVAVGVGCMVLNVVLAYSLVGSMGYVAIALALTLSTILEALLLWFLLCRRVPDVAEPALLLSLGRTAAAGLALYAAAAFAAGPLRVAGLPALIQAAGVCLAGGIAYLAVALISGSPELASMVSLIRGRLRR
jgi:putative peptidoglycan lipid II flippase